MAQELPFKPGQFVNWLLSLPEVQQVWETHIRHPFVLALGASTLPIEGFKDYLIQDYHFLTHYIRLMCLLAAKVPDFTDAFRGAKNAAESAEEASLHVRYCKGFGLSVEDMLAVPEHPACTAYVDFLRHVAQDQDYIALQIAMSPCALGYKVVGEYLANWDGTKRENNPYWPWIEQYSGTHYAQGVDDALAMLEKYISREPLTRLDSLVKLFIKAAELECGFWSIGFPIRE